MDWVILSILLIIVFLTIQMRRPVFYVHLHIWFTKDGEIIEGEEWKQGNLGDDHD